METAGQVCRLRETAEIIPIPRSAGARGGSFQFAADRNLALGADFQANYVRPTAHGTIFDVCLLTSRRDVDRHDDRFPAASADVACFILQECGALGLKFSRVL